MSTHTKVVCTRCHRLLHPDPDGSTFCAHCAAGWGENGWFLAALAAMGCLAAGTVGWMALWNGSVGWGLKNATGSLLLAIAMEVFVAGGAAELVRRVLPFERVDLQVGAWCAAVLGIPGILALVRIAFF